MRRLADRVCAGVTACARRVTVGAKLPTPPIEVAFPDLARWAAGNARHPVRLDVRGRTPGPHVLVQALTHGNEVCGAIALDWLLGEGLRPDARHAFGVLRQRRRLRELRPRRPVRVALRRRGLQPPVDRRGARRLAPEPPISSRARELRPLYDRVDYLLDLHSMTDPCPPLAMAGRQRKGVELAQALGAPEHIIVDGGHAAGKRLRDYAFFDDPDDPRNALLIECGQHWEARRAGGGEAGDAALPAAIRDGATRDSSTRISSRVPMPRAEGDRGDRRR